LEPEGDCSIRGVVGRLDPGETIGG